MSEPTVPYDLGPEPFRGWYRPVENLIPRNHPAILDVAEVPPTPYLDAYLKVEADNLVAEIEATP
jgi:hypothetical protein